MARPFSQDWEQKFFGGLGNPPNGSGGGTLRPRPNSDRPIGEGDPDYPVGAAPGLNRPVSDGTKYTSKEAEAIDSWFEDLNNYERTLEQLAEMKFMDNFKEEMQAVVAWFQSQNECERTTIIYALMRQCSQLQTRFFLMVLQQMSKKDPIASLLSPRTSMQELEKNNPELLGKVSSNEYQATRRLLEVLPSLHDDDVPSDSSDSFRLYNRHSFPQRKRQNAEGESSSGSWPANTLERHSAPPASSHYVLSNHTVPTEPLKPTRAPPPVPSSLKSASTMAASVPPSSAAPLNANSAAAGGNLALSQSPQPNQQASSPTTSNNPLPLGARPSLSHSASQPPKPIPPRNISLAQSQSLQKEGDSLSLKVMSVFRKKPVDEVPSPIQISAPLPSSFTSTSTTYGPKPPAPQLPSRPAPPIPIQQNSMPAGGEKEPEPPQPDQLVGNSGNYPRIPLRSAKSAEHTPLVVEINNTSPGVHSGNALPRAGSPPQPKKRPESEEPEPKGEEVEFDIPTWLKSLRLHKYTPILENMTWEQMVNLTDEELQDLGMAALGARRKILKEFETLKAEGFPPRAQIS